MKGLEFKIARIRQGRKQLEIAREARVHPTRLSKIENGWEEARPDEVERISTALNLDNAEIHSQMN